MRVLSIVFLSVIVFAADATAANLSGDEFDIALNKYRQGTKEYSALPSLIAEAERLHRTDVALAIATDYMRNYLDELDEDRLVTRENLDFFDEYQQLVTSNSPVFALYCRNPAKIDATIGHVGYSAAHAESIVTREEVYPIEVAVKTKNTDLDWETIKRSIEHKYGAQHAERVIVQAQVLWYLSKKAIWPGKSRKVLLRWLDENGLPGEMGNVTVANALETEVLRFDDNIDDLNKSIGWLERILNEGKDNGVDLVQGFVEPYAGLLYKVGRTTEAISWQKTVVQMAGKVPKESWSGPDWLDKRVAILDKMQRGVKFREIWLGGRAMYNDRP
jgi:hypothetical protein